MALDIGKLVSEAIAVFKEGKDASKKLRIINSDSLAFTHWVYETGTFIDEDDFILIINKETLSAEFEEYFAEHLSEEEKKELTDDNLYEFLISSFEQEECTSLHFTQVKGICLTCEAESMGQGGFQFSSFGLYDSRAIASESYKNIGYYLYGDPMPLKGEVVKLLRQTLNT
jgi:hypothetical protein